MEDLKQSLRDFVATSNSGKYQDEATLLSKFPELSGYDAQVLKDFVATSNSGSYASEEELFSKFPEFNQPVKKKEESVPLWLQKQEQPKPKQEQTPPFLESKPSGISLGSQRVPETAPMFEAPPMRTAEEAQAIVEAPQTADSEQGWLLNTVSALDKGFAKNLIGNPVKGMGTLLEGATSKVFGGTGKGPISDALISFGNYYNNAIDELTPQDEDFKNSLTDQFGQAFGQVASLIMTGGVAGAGKEGAALAATAPTGIVGTVAGAGKQLASTLVSPTAISGGLSMGQAEFDRAKEAGATDEQAYEVFFKNAAVGSVLEQIPVMQFLKRFNQSTAGGVANYIKTKGVAGLTGGFEEMTTEVLQQLYSNKTAQEIYNINQQLLEGVGESGGVGFGVGFILNAMGAKVKKLKKDGNTAEAQLIENQIENFESTPPVPLPTYSINGIKIESPEVINQMIDNMDATDLANSNIEITNDPELSVKMQDKMVTSSIKEEVRSASPELDENTLDQITALEKERKKFEGKKTQSAKDKLASINSQIKTLQENAVQKPSTEEIPNEISSLRDDETVVISVGSMEEIPDQFKDRAQKKQGAPIEIRESILGLPIGKKTTKIVNEGYSYTLTGKEAKDYAIQKSSTEKGVLRPEESQVGLQEVGKGNAQVQAPTEEVVQEEVVATPELSEDSQKIKTQLEDFQNAFDEAYNAEYPKSGTAQDKRSATAKSKKAVKKLQQMIGFDIGAYWELDADQTKKREALYSLRENKDYDSYDEMVSAYQKDVAEGNQSKLVESINTLLGLAPKVKEAVATPPVDSILESTRAEVAKLQGEVDSFSESIGRSSEKIKASQVDRTRQDLGDNVIKAKRKISTAEDTDVAIEEFKQAEKERDAFEERIAKDSEFEKVNSLIYDEVEASKKDNYEHKELFDQDPRLAALQSAKDMVEFAKKYPDENIKTENYVNEIKILEEDIAKFPVKQAEATPKVSSKTQKAKTLKAKSVPIPVAIPKPAPAPAPKPVAVVSQPTQRVQGPDALRQEYINKTNDVRLNKDKSRTPKQIDERIAELKAEYQKLKAEMTAPRPKAEPEAKAAPKAEAKPAPKKAEPVVKSKLQQSQDFADKLSAMSQEERDNVEYDENYRGYQLFEARKAMPKTSNSPKFKKVNEDNSSTLYNDYEYIANIDGEPYGLVKYEDPDDPDNDKAFVWAYEKVGTDDLFQTWTSDNEELISEIKSQISKEVKATPKAEPTSVVEEEGPSYEDIEDLDVSDPTLLEIVDDYLEGIEDGLENFGRGNLSSGIAIPAAKLIIKAIRALVRAGITLQEAIKRVAADNNVEVKDIVNMIKELDKSQSPIVKLKDQIKSEARAALNAKKDINQKRKDLSNTIKEMETTGKISAAKAKAILNKIGKVNLDNPAAVDTFLDYVENVFENAEYEVEIAGINAKLGKARNNVNRKIGTAKNLTPVLNKLFNIKPSLIPSELLDAYKNLVDMFGDSAAVLDLSEITEVTKQAQDILNQIDDQLSTVPALASKLFNYDKAVLDEDGALDYSATIEKMLADEVIDEAEYKLMKKYKSLILPRAVKIPKTKQELADEKKVLVKQVKEAASETTISELASDDEKKMASNIIKLAKTNAVEALDNRQLENLLKIFDNFSNGYFPAYANGLSNDLIAGENATFLSKAIAKAKMPSLASVKLKLRNKRQALFAKVKTTPLFNIDEIFGDFKTKDIFNSIFNALAQNQQRYALEIEKISQRLEDALNKIAKGYGNNENKIVESKMRMAIYRIQREFESNPGDPSVNPAIEYINKTIEAIREGDTNYSEEDADMLERIAKDYSDGKGGIDAKKLDKSFNTAEKEALNLFDEINKEIEGKAIFTGDVIRGDKVRLLNNYNHINVLPAKGKESDPIADVMSKFNPKNVVSTKAKSLIERSSGAKPINFDIFSTVQRGAKFVLMDYYLTNPIRIARKTVNTTAQMMQENGTLNEGTKTILNVVKDAMELSLKSSLDQSAFKDSFGDKVIKEMAKTGYRSMLGGVPRATTEFTSNMAYIAMVAPTEWTAGVKMMKNIDGSKAVSIMKAVGSKAIIRTYGSDPLKGRLVDPSVLSKRVGIGASKLKGETLNVIATIHNNTTKKVKNSVEFVADTLISTPDKIMMRPLWFGSFEKAFEDFSGKKPDLDKIADNDADYMIKNKESLEAAGRVADEKVVMAGDVDNPYMNSLRTYIPSDASGLAKTFKVFDNFMLKFQIRDYLNARRGIHAMMGNGNISKEQGAKLMAAVVTRMTVYTVMGKMAAEFMYGLFLDDEDEDDDKSFAQKLGQGLASTFTSLLFGRDYGNSIRSVVNYGVEKVNEKYLDFLRDGEYDPYEDAIQYTFIPPEKKGKSLEAFDVISNIAGPYSPAVKSLNFVTKKLTEEPKKEAAAIERQEKEKNIRVPLEILGNLGYVPMYKDIRAIVNKSIYSELDKELDQQGQKGEEFKPMGMNKTDLERYYPEIYEQYYGAGSEAEAKRKLEYEKNLLERKMKDDYYNYVPKQRPKKGFGGKEFGSGSSKKGGGFGSKGFGK